MHFFIWFVTILGVCTETPGVWSVRAFVKFMCVRLLVLQSASISYVSARVQLTFVGNWY